MRGLERSLPHRGAGRGGAEGKGEEKRGKERQ